MSTTSVLPLGWAIVPLVSLGAWFGGGTPSKSKKEYWTGGAIPWVSPKDMKRSRIRATEDYITEAAVRGSATKLLPPGSVLVVTRSGILEHSLPTAVADVEVSLNQDLKGLVPNGAVLPDYLQAALRSYAQSILANCSKAGTTVSSIEFPRLLEFQVPLAPLNEQRRIVAKIEELTNRSRRAREALDAVPALLDRFRQSVLAAAFRGDLTAEWRVKNPDVEPASVLLERIRQERRRKWEDDLRAKGKDPAKAVYSEPESVARDGLPDLPDGWCWVSAEQCTSLITDGEHITPKRADTGVLLLSARNVRDGHLNFDQVDYVPEDIFQGLCRRLKVTAGDVLMSCSGTVGRSCVAPPGLEFALVRSVAVLRPVLDMSEFLSLAIRSPLLQNQIDGKKTQTAQSNIFQGRIKKLVFPLPPLEEQRQIVAVVSRQLSAAKSQITCIDTCTQALDQLDHSILTKAFRGELVPQDPNDEPASVLLERIRGERAEAVVPKARRGRKPRELAEARE